MRPLVLVVLLFGLNAVTAESVSAASRACGSIVGPLGHRLPVTAQNGAVTCATARKAMRRFLPRSGAGKQLFRLAKRDWFCADAHGRLLIKGGVARCSSGRLVVVAFQPTPRAGEDREHPLPFGATGTLGDWKVQVLSVTPDATAEVLAENSYNDPPTAGRQFYIATVRATFTGSKSARFDGGYRLRSVGASAVEYTTFDESCGVIPQEISDNDVFSGGTVEGNVCWQIRSSDVASLLMYDDGGFLESGGPVFYALTP